MKKYTRNEIIAIYTPYVIANKSIDNGTVPEVKTTIANPIANLTVTSIMNLSTRYSLPTVRTVQRAFGTLEAFREALGMPESKKPKRKSKKPMYEVVLSAYLFLKENHGEWNVQRQYMYDDTSLPFPIGIKSSGEKTDLFEFIDALTTADLEKEAERLKKKHKMINDDKAFYSRAFNVWIVNINRDAKIKIENGILPKQWTVISTEEFRNLFQK